MFTKQGCPIIRYQDRKLLAFQKQSDFFKNFSEENYRLSVNRGWKIYHSTKNFLFSKLFTSKHEFHEIFTRRRLVLKIRIQRRASPKPMCYCGDDLQHPPRVFYAKFHNNITYWYHQFSFMTFVAPSLISMQRARELGTNWKAVT